jgi:hypothetical protein
MPRGGSLVLFLSLSLTVHAQEALAPFVPSNANIVGGNVLRGQLLWGRTESWPGAPDWFCRQSESHSNVSHPLADGTPKCYARGLVLGDIGDPPDLVLRRAGPDGAGFSDLPQPVADGTPLGGLYWQWLGRRIRCNIYAPEGPPSRISASPDDATGNVEKCTLQMPKVSIKKS